MSGVLGTYVVKAQIPGTIFLRHRHARCDLVASPTPLSESCLLSCIIHLTYFRKIVEFFVNHEFV